MTPTPPRPVSPLQPLASTEPVEMAAVTLPALQGREFQMLSWVRTSDRRSEYGMRDGCNGRALATVARARPGWSAPTCSYTTSRDHQESDDHQHDHQ